MCELHGFLHALPFLLSQRGTTLRRLANSWQFLTVLIKQVTLGPFLFFMFSKQVTSPKRIITRSDLASYLDVDSRGFNDVLSVLSRRKAYVSHIIPKANGGERQIHAVTGPLKRFQKIALSKLIDDYVPSSYAHGFMPSKSIFTNAYIHRNQKLVLRIDIADFFPSINFGRVLGMFQARPFSFGAGAATAMAQLSCLEEPSCGLPQGGVLSPYIANMICRRLDARLAGLAKMWKCRFTRYADDIVFSTNDSKRLNAEKLIDEISRIITDEGFSVNDDKTRLMTRSQRQMVTGVVVNEGININRRYYRSLRALLHNWEQHGIVSQLLKNDEFKDPRNPRPNIVQRDKQFFKNGVLIDRKDAELTFARHVLGRINFLLYATTFVPSAMNGGWNDEKLAAIESDRDNRRAYLMKQPRARAAQLLLIRFHELTRKNTNLKEVTKAALKRISEYPELKSEIGCVQRRDRVRSAALSKYRASENCKELIKRIDEAKKSAADLKNLICDLSKRDIRFAQVLKKSSLDELAKNSMEVAKYPPLNMRAAADLLGRLRNSQEGLGRIVHDNNELSMIEIHEMLESAFDPVFYQLNTKLRKEFDDLEDILEVVAIKEGLDNSINWFADERSRVGVQRFKSNTRFGIGSSPLPGTVNDIIKKTESDSKSRGITFESSLKNASSFYTHVPSVELALKYILGSLVKHCPDDDVIKISLGSSEEFWELKVTSTTSGPIPRSATRDFANGKLNGAASQLNGLAQYKFTACFEDGPHSIDMMSGTVELIEDCMTEGVSHILYFPKV